MKKAIFKTIFILSIVFVGCDDNLEEKVNLSKDQKPISKEAMKYLDKYTMYKGPSQVEGFVNKSISAPKSSDRNARNSVGLSIDKACIDSNPSLDYIVDVAAGAYIGVDWFLINPSNQYQFLETTGDPDGTDLIWNTIEFQLLNPSLGTWTILGVSYIYDEFNATGICPGTNPCTFSVDASFQFNLPLTGFFVSAGSSSDLSAYRNPYNYTLPLGYTASSILDIAIDYDNNLVVAWFKDGKRSSGTTSDLDSNGLPAAYTLPPGYVISDIVAIDIDGDVDRSYTWYKNGKRSIGSSTDLDAYGAPVNYTLPAGYTPNDIIDIAIDGTVNWSWVYFKNGKKCAGSTTNLSSFSALQNYTLPCTYLTTNIVGIACDGDINTMYTWYNK